MDLELIELALEDLDMMVENARQNCTMVRFLEVVHSANTIRKSLEKQISMQVSSIDVLYEDTLDGFCPSCEEYVTNRMLHCVKCGQKLSWKTEDDDFGRS